MLDDIRTELTRQGHKLTGATANSLRSEVFMEGATLVLEGWGSKVVVILNRGTTAERIPYTSGRQSGAKHSAYIQGLAQYAKLRFGVSEKQALGIAFAIANKQEKEGMPTQGSYQYSETGQRTGAVDEALERNREKFDQKVNDAIDDIVNEELNKQKSETI